MDSLIVTFRFSAMEVYGLTISYGITRDDFI
jgi:hypothetical protein